MTTKNSSAGKKETKSAEKKPSLTAIQKVLKVINTHRSGICSIKVKSFNHNNTKGFNDMDDRVHLKNIVNKYALPYTEDSILDKDKFNFGEGCIVFRDGMKYTVKKQDGGFVVV